MDPWYFAFHGDLPLGHVSLTLYPAGESVLITAGNYRGRQEIGRYQWRVPSAPCDRFRASLKRSEYTGWPVVKQLGPDQPSVTLGEGSAGAAPADRTFALSSPPPGLGPLLAEVDRIADELLAHPLRVVAASAKWKAPRFESGSAIDLVLSFRNTGVEALTLDDPLGGRDGADPPLRISIARAVPATSQEPAAVEQADVARSEVRAVGSQSGGTGAPTTLAPGAVLEVEVKKPVYLAPGSYSGRIEYWSLTAPQSKTHVAGSLHVDVGSFEVTTRK